MSSMDSIHVYERELEMGKRTSLSLLAGMVASGTRVLDVGIGGGALGAFLRQSKGCVLDGVTYNAEEAELAGAHYRAVHVADLDQHSLSELLANDGYDYIICADVLEHLRDPGRVLDVAHSLLKDNGRLLISVPNVAYLGLIAELLGGEFRYRHEGLLDKTHVRFFTRNSLLSFLSDHGWRVLRFEAIDLDVADSEFAPAFDALAPAVRTQLLTNPDGLVYQFVLEAERCPTGQQVDHAHLLHGGVQTLAHYALNLYCANAQGYSEANKVSARARITQQRQCVVFDLSNTPLYGLRLDPADRPGFMHLYDIVLKDSRGITLWQWDGDLIRLQDCCHQIVASCVGREFDAASMLMVGNDPYIELPIEKDWLALASGGQLCVTLSWPMSADYLVLAERAALHIADGANQLSAMRAARDTTLDEVKNVLAEVNNAHSALRKDYKLVRQELMSVADNLAETQKQANHYLAARDDMAKQLDAVLNSTIFRATRPLLRAKERFGALFFDPPSLALVNGKMAPKPISDVVDVIVPIYRSLSDTRCCVESVLSSQTKTPIRLVLINDCSPEPEVTDYLRTLLARDPRVLLLENTVNLGFVATVNRGMALDTTRDVLLLNSDAEVANDWLDRMRAAAYSEPRISSVTPLSNNATICSYPRFCEANELPSECDTAALDALCREVNPSLVVDVPTGVGFCMYIRRESLVQVGLFDTENFGKGYGEENDFCMRSANAGWRHVLALDTFVRHAGGVSFGDAKTPREIEAVEILRRLHPAYDGLVHAHVTADPARVPRMRIDLARIRAFALPAVLFVTHSRGGGTERHVQELVKILDGKALCFTLKPLSDGVTELSWARPGEAFKLGFRLPADLGVLVDTLRGLGVAHVHFHHLIGHDASVSGLAGSLGVRHDYTLHDYYAVCPQISLTDHKDRYCGEQGTDQCRTCLKRTPAPGGVDIETWRKNFSVLLDEARTVFVPSHDAAKRVARYVPTANVRVVPHKDLAIDYDNPNPTALGDRPLRIVVLGALSPIKGADVVEAMAKLAATQAAPIEIHLIGYAYRPLQTQPKACLTVHGAYADADLDALLLWIKPDVVWFPAQWPETYSYTLSACLKASLPVVVPDIGAFAERVKGRQWSWVFSWASTAAECLEFFKTIRSQHFQLGVAPHNDEIVNALPAPFDYLTDYLEAITPRATLPLISNDILLCHSDMQSTGLAAIGEQVRGRALAAMVQVRNHPVMRRVVRWVPLRWQIHLKNWLLK